MCIVEKKIFKNLIILLFVVIKDYRKIIKVIKYSCFQYLIEIIFIIRVGYSYCKSDSLDDQDRV